MTEGARILLQFMTFETDRLSRYQFLPFRMIQRSVRYLGGSEV
jgi:hypothetical protein